MLVELIFSEPIRRRRRTTRIPETASPAPARPAQLGIRRHGPAAPEGEAPEPDVPRRHAQHWQVQYLRSVQFSSMQWKKNKRAVVQLTSAPVSL